MRAELNTIQQTLTPEALTVLNQSITEAARRNHGQTTPLHVAATLLSSPTGYLRQACIKSHPNSSHPLQCRALELCFSVALERLPAAQNSSPGLDPPLSNALMAALKRAQAHQRKGCPEQQQQPLLAVKVELEQLIVSILDDPSVSRVMREASFSSPVVKASIEEAMFGNCLKPVGGYVNPKLKIGKEEEEVKKVVDVLRRSKKRNPVLVGELEPELVVKEVLRRVECKELGDLVFRDVKVVNLGMELGCGGGRIGELVEGRIGEIGGGGGGVIVDLGDLKWLVGFVGPGAQAVAQMGRVLGRLREGGARVWLIGTATCETYLRCQVYYPNMESDWDLQAVPIAARSPGPGMFPRLASNGLLGSSMDSLSSPLKGSSMESLSPLKGLSTLVSGAPTPWRLPDKFDPVQRMKCCPQCNQSYALELAKITAKDSDRSSAESRQEVGRPPLPLWLRSAKSQDSDVRALDQSTVTSPGKDQEQTQKQKILELQKKWHDACLQQHPRYHQSDVGSERTAPALPALSMSIHNTNALPRQPLVPKIQLDRNFVGALQLNPSLSTSQSPIRPIASPGSPVGTDLVLGRPKVNETTFEEGNEDRTKDFLSLAPPEEQIKLHELPVNEPLSSSDTDSCKRLVKGLLEKVSWQREAATAVATSITQCKLGNGKRRGAGSKGDIWLLFLGPDKFGKKKMASALSDIVCGPDPVVVCLGSRRDDGESELCYRGKTALDQIVDAVRRNPFSVIVLEDIDKADMLVRGSIKRAIEKGRIADSHGREISLGNVIFILTTNWLPDNLRFPSDGVLLDESKLAKMASGGWQLRLSLCQKTAKRRAHWLEAEDRPAKPKKDAKPKDSGSALSFDLNEAADAEDNKADGSDLTTECGDEPVLNSRLLMPATSSVSGDLLNHVDENIIFKPADFGAIRRDISNSITKMFASMIGDTMPVEIQEEALEKIVAGVCQGRIGLEEWTQKVIVPSIHQLKLNIPASASELMVIRLEIDGDSNNRHPGGILPNNIRVLAQGSTLVRNTP